MKCLIEAVKERPVNFLFIVVWSLIVGMAIVAEGGERPASAPPIDERLTGIESRLDTLERAVEALKTGKCPCPEGGECICPDDNCPCPDCPKHKKAKGVKLLGFKTSWCAHCPGAEKDCEGLAIEWVDADTDPRAKQYHATSYPALIRLVNGEKDGHFEGRTGMANKAREWLAAPANESKPSSPAHNGHRQTVRYSQPVRYAQPAYYQPRTYYRPSYGSYCPNCVR